MITYTVHSALYLLQTKISRLLIAGFVVKTVKNTRYKLQNICQFTLLDKNIQRFILKANSCMFLSFVTIMKGLYIMVHA